VQTQDVLKVTYDPEADAAYVYLLVDVPSHSTPEDETGMITDLAEDGRLIGFEVLGVVAMPGLDHFTNLPDWAREAIRALVAGSNSISPKPSAG
jgi:uncharacterized protein YuzE